jgi:zinc transporter
MDTVDGLICAYHLDGKGSGRELGWDDLAAARNAAGTLWIHLDRKHARSREWILQHADVDAVAGEALLAEETRPRSVALNDGMLVILRGVNLNPGAEPDDMISIRMWVDSRRIISLRFPRLRAVDDIRQDVAQGCGPTGPGDFLVILATRLLERTGPVLDKLDDALDELEDQIVEAHSQEQRTNLGTLRRQAIQLRRYLAPQRDVLARLQAASVSWLGELHRARLREVHDRLVRYVEDLDAIRERAAVTQEELTGRLSEQMNKTMYVLSIVAALFLPLGFLTGLLGINVGGIPGTENDAAFAVVCVILGLTAIIALWLLRRFRLF